MSLNHSPASPDLLLQQLSRCEGQLSAWLTGSENNAAWFARDPVAAMRAAGLGLDEATLRDLEEITASIAQKISAVM
jgi:hypothetical protein